MKAVSRFLAVAVTGFLMFVPSIGLAEMEHHGGESHMHDDSQHHPMEMSGRRETVNMIFEDYFEIQTSLAKDSTEGVSNRAGDLAKAAEKFHHDSAETAQHDHEGKMHEILDGIESGAKSLAKAKDIDSAREEFAGLSANMVEFQKFYGNELPRKTHAYVCDMAKHVWLQEDEQPRNPYFGSAMLRCARKL